MIFFTDMLLMEKTELENRVKALEEQNVSDWQCRYISILP